MRGVEQSGKGAGTRTHRGYARFSTYHRYLKKAKLRQERRRAKVDVECVPCYRKYRGYET